MASRVRVYVASSLDGFIAGDCDDLSWLPAPEGPNAPDYGFARFLSQVGVLLMGRRTFDVARSFEGSWPYGTLPILVATHRELGDTQTTVRAVNGSIEELLSEAKQIAGLRDVYLDGGELIRNATEAGLVDEFIVTIVPTILGSGRPLFAGSKCRQSLRLCSVETLPGGMVQLTYLPQRSPEPD